MTKNKLLLYLTGLIRTRGCIFGYYLLTILIILLFGVIKLKFCLEEREKNYEEILQTATHVPFGEIQKELSKIFNLLDLIKNEPNNISFLNKNLMGLFFKNNKVVEHKNKEFNFQINDKVLQVTSGYYTIFSDISLLTDLISTNISPLISYDIFINDRLLVTSKEQSKGAVVEKIKIPYGELIIKISIDKHYKQQNRSYLIRKQITEYIFIIIPIVITNIIFLLLYVRPVTIRAKETKTLYLVVLEEIKLLYEYTKLKNKYNEWITIKIKQKIKNIVLNSKEDHTEMLYYPMLLNNFLTETIDSGLFLQDLSDFFKYLIYKKEIDFHCVSGVNGQFTINLSKESFYQLVFSLVFNVIHLLQNKAILRFELKINNENLQEIIVTYSGFQLNKEQLITYTNHNNQGELFLLNMEETVKGLELHGFFYDIQNIYHNKNIISLKSRIFQKHSIGNDNNSKIINFKDYSNR